MKLCHHSCLRQRCAVIGVVVTRLPALLPPLLTKCCCCHYRQSNISIVVGLGVVVVTFVSVGVATVDDRSVGIGDSIASVDNRGVSVVVSASVDEHGVSVVVIASNDKHSIGISIISSNDNSGVGNIIAPIYDRGVAPPPPLSCPNLRLQRPLATKAESA